MIGLDTLFKNIQAIDSLDRAGALLRQVTSSSGILYYCYAGYTTCRERHGVEYETTNYPSAWRAKYHERGWFAQDPLLQVVRRAVAPVEWSDFFSGSRPSGNEIVFSRVTEVSSCGVSINIGPCHGVRGILSIAGAEDLSIWKSEKNEFMRDFLCIAVMIHDAYARIYIKSKPNSEELSARQKECLLLAAEGMTTKSISSELVISERTVREYIENIRLKLDCKNRSHAISKAIQLGLI